MSFAQQLRRSAFAKYDPKLPRIFEKHVAPSVFDKELKFEDVPHTPTFALKSDPPGHLFGKAVKWASFKDLDGSFGSATFVNEESRVIRRKIYDYMDSLYKYCQNNPEKPLPKIPARVISSAEGGFIIGVGPVMAFLPQCEIPVGVNFSYSDMLDKKAYYFKLKSIESLPIEKKTVVKNDDVFCETIQSAKFAKPDYASIASTQGFKVTLTLK